MNLPPPALVIRRAAERGQADHGWLRSAHSFAFADYFDPEQVEFGALRVINEDRVAPAMGFPTHGHRDMEIISYVIAGQLQHRDSMGNGSVIRPGDVQHMSAGSGVLHSEFNPSPIEPVHFLQIWIKPDRSGIAPSYDQRHFGPEAKRGRLCLLAAGDGAQGALRLQQDARLSAALLDGDEKLDLRLDPGRRYYLHLIRGSLQAGAVALEAGDAIKLLGQNRLQLGQGCDAELLLFDLAL